MKNDVMSFAMLVMLFGLFGWAGYEYAKAGYEAWRDNHRVPAATEAIEEEDKKK